MQPRPEQLCSLYQTSVQLVMFYVSGSFPSWQIKQVQDEERKQLTQLRDVLKSALQVEQKEVTHTQFLKICSD